MYSPRKFTALVNAMSGKVEVAIVEVAYTIPTVGDVVPVMRNVVLPTRSAPAFTELIPVPPAETVDWATARAGKKRSDAIKNRMSDFIQITLSHRYLRR